MTSALKKLGVDLPDYERRGWSLDGTGKDVYDLLVHALRHTSKWEDVNAQRSASKFLSSIGFVGINFPAEYQSGGRKDGKMNYVIFDEADARITDHVRFFRTADGEAYGFTVGGKVYIDPRMATSETAIHEYTHLWTDMLRRTDPKQWERLVKELKGSRLWEEVKRNYPKLETDDEIADEVLSTLSGRRGSERLRKEMDEMLNGDGSVTEKAAALSALERVKKSISDFWRAVLKMFGINRYYRADELADMALKDLLAGKNPMRNETEMKRGEVGRSLATSGSYFSGGGLLEEGLKGLIDPKVAVEFNEKIAGVYSDNHGNHIVVADVRDVDPKQLVSQVEGGEVQYFHASPVCKNFSSAKQNGGEVALDMETAKSTAEFIAATRPKASPRVLARVTGLSDDYKMPPTDKWAHTIIGNGIPARMTENVIGPLIHNAIPAGERATQRRESEAEKPREQRTETNAIEMKQRKDKSGREGEGGAIKGFTAVNIIFYVFESRRFKIANLYVHKFVYLNKQENA